jgi:hypothetical protein
MQGVPAGMRAKKKIRVYFTPNGAQLSVRQYLPIPKEPSIRSVLPTGATLETISRKEPMAVLAGAIRITMDTQ